MRWEELREEEFEDAIARSKGVCVLPIGCLEKHGQHLPVGTDYLVAEGIVNMAAQLEEVVVFPTGPWVGVSIRQHQNEDPGATHKRGYIGMNPHTLLTVLEELCDEIARNGFRKILLVSAHGGNKSMLDYLTQLLNYKKRDYAVMVIPSIGGLLINGEGISYAVLRDHLVENRAEYPDITDEDIAVLSDLVETGKGKGHASFAETSAIFGLHPHLVRPDLFDKEDGMSTHRADHLTRYGLTNTQVFWDANYPNAYNGYAPHGCSEAIGKARNKLLAQHLAKAFKAAKEDEDAIRMTMCLPPL